MQSESKRSNYSSPEATCLYIHIESGFASSTLDTTDIKIKDMDLIVLEEV